MPLDAAALTSRLREHSDCFDELLETIPAKYYYQAPQQAEEGAKKKKSKNKQAELDLQRKENSKKGKIAKLDPANSQTILDIQERAAAEKKAPASIAELKERLHAEIAALGKQRTASEDGGQGSQQRKRKKLKEAEEKEDDAPKKKQKQQQKVSTKMRDDDDDDEHDEFEGEDMEEDVEGSADEGEDDDDGMQFGRIIDGQEGSAGKRKRKLSKTKLLEKAEQYEDYISNASEEDKKRILEQKSWRDALAKATGKKMKDNPALLKKSIKREEKQKARSQKEWKGRVDKVTAEKQARQDKRRANIKAEKDKRKNDRKNGQKGAGKKKQRPGFEGKKSGFLNKKESGGKRK